MKIVRIEWIDSTASMNEWEHRDGIKRLKPLLCVSVGFLLEDTAAYVTLTHSKSKTQVCGRLTIPTACIKKCTRLK